MHVFLSHKPVVKLCFTLHAHAQKNCLVTGRKFTSLTGLHIWQFILVTERNWIVSSVVILWYLSFHIFVSFLGTQQSFKRAVSISRCIWDSCRRLSSIHIGFWSWRDHHKSRRVLCPSQYYGKEIYHIHENVLPRAVSLLGEFRSYCGPWRV